MQVIVLSGDAVEKERYIEDFKISKKITPYLVVRFDEGFKISDARALQKLFSSKLQNHENRLVIITSPTSDSQHALLKTLEELPEHTFLIFSVSSKEELFPTVLSRALYVDLGAPQIDIDEKLVEAFQNPDSVNTLLSLISPTPSDDDIKTFIVSLRHTILGNIQNTYLSHKLLRILSELQKNYSLSRTNNINKKMVLEVSLLQ